ncbi:hypothetical protein VTJ49DRAFT_5734 [Mycothermus thermophilus]|uniref:Uncharacterized protein n=1 Tax=Humicola insolens TaxID=85995 RepID=A0ABR3VKH9_HUMIN
MGLGRTWTSAAGLVLAASSAAAQNSMGYITDMPGLDAIAPCVYTAVSWKVLALTSKECPDEPSELRDCFCTKNNIFGSVSSDISSVISRSCSSVAALEQLTARSIMSAYCNPSLTLDFPTPTEVQSYITDFPEISYLAPCAQSAIMYGVRTMTYDLCPSDPAMLASCVCSKSANLAVVSSKVSSSAKSMCKGHVIDASSALDLFNAYCLMASGTTSFPIPSDPPGDMTYYITDLPQYSSLARCAQTGLASAVQGQTDYLCPNGPKALASCVCFKQGMTTEVSQELTSWVKSACGSTAVDDVRSAMSVYNYYCEAADAKVTPVGVLNSIEQIYTTREGQSSVPTNPPGSSNGSGSGSDNSSGDDDDDDSSSGPGTGLIIGAAVGGIGGLIVLGVIVFFIFRSVRKSKQESLRIPDNAPDVPLDSIGGKAELPSDSVAAVPPPPASPSPSTLKAAAAARADTVSPLSSAATKGPYSPPPTHAELAGQTSLHPPLPNRPELATPPPPSPSPSRAELQGQNSMYPPPPQPNASELYGQGTPPPNRPELQGQNAMFPPPPPPNTQELPGQGQGQYAGYHHPGVPQGAPSPHQPPYPSPMQSPYLGHPQSYPNSPSPMHSPHQAVVMPGGPYPGYQGYGQQMPPPPPPQQYPPSAWQSGPVPEYHEMEGSVPRQQQGQGQQGQ